MTARAESVDTIVHAILGVTRYVTTKNGVPWTPDDEVSEILTRQFEAIRADERRKCADRMIKSMQNIFFIISDKSIRATIEQEDAP